jgi:RNA polymerase sigma-70 factor (ECF subfamily)
MVDQAMRATVQAPAATRIESLFVANERRLGQFVMQMVRDRALADDLLQETFVAAFKARDQLGEVDDPVAWLFGIARHRALVALRRTRRMRRAMERLRSSTETTGTHGGDIDGVMDMLDRSLSPDDRSLVVLRYVHGFNASQLAELTGRSPASIRKRLERACATLSREAER